MHVEGHADGQAGSDLAHAFQQRPFPVYHALRHHSSVQVKQGSIKRALRAQRIENAACQVVIRLLGDEPGWHAFCRDRRHDLSADFRRQVEIGRNRMIGAAIGRQHCLILVHAPVAEALQRRWHGRKRVCFVFHHGEEEAHLLSFGHMDHCLKSRRGMADLKPS